MAVGSISVKKPSPALQPAFLKALRAITGTRFILDKPEERLVYECDACILIKAPPDVIALPNSAQQVSEIIKLCIQYKVPYVARGSGTGLSGGALAIAGGLIIGLNRMTAISEIDIKNGTATVGVGVINASLTRAVAPLGFFYAPDPSSQSACTLGGNIAENAGGIHCIKYGVTTDHVLGMEVVLPNGNITWLGGKNRRVQGLNLVGLMVGSEGTLGIVTQAIVQLVRKPQSIKVFLAAFNTVKSATQCVSDIIASGVLPSAVEFIDAFTVKAVNEAFHVGFPEESQAVLLVEADGSTFQANLESEKIHQFLTRHSATQIRVATTEEECQTLWKARKGAVAAYGRIYPAMYVHDCVVPRSSLSEVLEKMTEITDRYRITVGNVFHAGDGNLHPNILFDPNDAEMTQRVLQAGEEILALCISVGGTLTGEHGVGIEKSEFMSHLYSQEDLEKMKAVKRAFDPLHLCNPGKMFPVHRGCGETHASYSPVARSSADGSHLKQAALPGKPFSPHENPSLWI